MTTQEKGRKKPKELRGKPHVEFTMEPKKGKAKKGKGKAKPKGSY